MRTKLALLATLAFLGCKSSANKEPAEEHSSQPSSAGFRDAGQPRGTLSIDPEMLRDLRITTTQAEARAGGEGVTVLGELKVNEEAYAEVGSPIAARVVRMVAAPGDAVKTGQSLVELQSVELGKARADYLGARAQAELAGQTLTRKRGLTADRIAPQRELQQAEAEASAAEARLRAARATLRALGTSEEDLDKGGDADARLTLRSPIAGTVIERNVARGQMADPSKPLYRIADLSHLWLTVHAFERDAVRVKGGATARVTFPRFRGAPSPAPWRSSEARSTSARARFPSASR